MIKKISKNKKNVSSIPEESGVYQFRDENNDIIYVGKAINLRSRIRSYFSQKLERKTAAMVNSARYISYITVRSEIEALLLEAKLVRKYKPKYNIELRDDKSPLYIGITKEEYPRVITLRQTQLEDVKLKKIFGPFVNSTAPKSVLKRFRRVVPYCTHKPGKRACVYSQIGLCNPCSSVINSIDDPQLKKELKSLYAKNIAKLSRMLSGQIRTVKKDLQKQLEDFSKNEEFESAKEILEQIKQIDYVLTDIEPASSYITNPNLVEDIYQKELDTLNGLIASHFTIKNLTRIECYDVAHIAGSHPTASMVTFIGGKPDKSLYRQFKVRQTNTSDDFASLKEVLARRRKRFSDWGVPDLIVIDGGKGQLSTIAAFIDEVPVVGLAKRFETLVFLNDDGSFTEKRVPKGPALNLLQRMRDEAHRFARRYHHKLVSKSLTDIAEKDK